MSEYKRYKVKWLINVLRLGKRGRTYVSLGFCEKTGKVAFISVGAPNKPMTEETFRPFVIHDIYTNGRCGDGKWCWNLNCMLNKASLPHFRRYIGKKAKISKLTKVSRMVQEWGDMVIDQVDWAKPSISFYKKPLLIYQEEPNI